MERHSNNKHYAITDEEIVTIFLYGIMNGCTTLRQIFDFAKRHLSHFFPKLGKYKSFNHRINKMPSALVFICNLLADVNAIDAEFHKWLVDSLPIILAGKKRSGRAKVAPDLANKGFCASKNMYFYGVKLHCIGESVPGSIPQPQLVMIAPASYNDQLVFEQMSDSLENGVIFGDKAYCDEDHKEKLKKEKNVNIYTPKKAKQNGWNFPGSCAYSTWVSSIRQPIESFFNWLQEKTKIQYASKVRSSDGLLVHIFGRLAAAMMMLTLI